MMDTNTLFGWTLDQWAIALAWYGGDVYNYKRAREAKWAWMASHNDNGPSIEPIIVGASGEDIRGKDYDAAIYLFCKTT